MTKLIVRKNGPLKGEVVISGAKNSVLKLMAASILAEEKCIIENVPDLKDVKVMSDMLIDMGLKVVRIGSTLEIYPTDNIKTEPKYELVTLFRASIITLGPLLGKAGKARLAQPGGCQIGERKIDLHIKGLTALGVDMRQTHGCVEGVVKN